jgi:hypothetical protein
LKTKVTVGESDTLAMLERIKRDGITLVVHNYAFEWPVTKWRFPSCVDIPMIDTMRLLQNADNGGYSWEPPEMDIDRELEFLEADKEPEEIPTGLSLVAGCKRYLPVRYHDHKAPFHALIRERGAREGKEGENLHLLTAEELAAYNAADAEVTLLLYEVLTAKFESGGYDWRLDHNLYQSTARLVSQSQARGVRIDRERLAAHCETKAADLEEIARAFKERFRDEIKAIENDMRDELLAQYKTARGRENAKIDVVFNTRSTKQLARLFVGKLGMKAKFVTKKGAPSFASKFLKQWGDGGLVLKKQRTILLELKQGESLYELSAEDSRWHLTLKICSTRSGRMSGGSNY